MNRDSLFLNNEDDEPKKGRPEKTPPTPMDNVTPAQALNQIVHDAVSEFSRVTGQGPYMAKLTLLDAETRAMMTVKKYTLDDVGTFAADVANDRVLPAFSILNDILPRLSILRQMLFMSESLNDDHMDHFIPRLNSTIESAMDARNAIIALMDRLNEISFSMIHKHNYDYDLFVTPESGQLMNVEELFKELEDEYGREEDGSAGDPSHDGPVQSGD
jgi:hypothetical protein